MITSIDPQSASVVIEVMAGEVIELRRRGETSDEEAHTFRAFVQDLSDDLVRSFVDRAYKELGRGAAKSLVGWLHDERFDLSRIHSASRDFKPWEAA